MGQSLGSRSEHPHSNSRPHPSAQRPPAPGEPLPIRMTWGIPRESGIQKAHTRSPAQYSQTRLRRRRQGAVIVGRHRACPGRGRGGLPGAAALGAGEQQPPRRRLAQSPGSRAPLRVGGAPRRCAHLTGGPPRRRPPRLGCRPRAACERVLLGSARAPLGLGCGVSRSCRLGSRAGFPPAPAASGLARVSGRSSSSRCRCYRPGSHKAPEWSCTRAHTPSQPPPPRPASRLPRRPPPALPPRTPPRTHASHSHSPGRTLARSHLRRGRGRGPWTGFGRRRGTPGGWRLSSAAQTSPSALPPPGQGTEPGSQAWSVRTGTASRETTQRPDQLEEMRPPGAARPEARRLRSFAVQLPRGRSWLDGSDTLMASPWDSRVGPRLGGWRMWRGVVG